MNELAVIVLSCDKYRDAWQPFYHFFKKYWGDCPYPVYHVSESLQPEVAVKTKFIATGDKPWSAMLSDALAKIDEKYILLLLEDYFLLKKTSNEHIENCISILKNENAACLRIFPCPGPSLSFKNYEDIGLINIDAKYAINTQATIWDKNILKQLLSPGETAWKFEQHVCQRAKGIEKKFLSVKVRGDAAHLETGDYPYTYLCTAIVQGKWTKEAVDLCRKENIKLDLKYREKLTWLEAYFYRNYDDIPALFRKLIYFFIPRRKA